VSGDNIRLQNDLYSVGWGVTVVALSPKKILQLN